MKDCGEKAVVQYFVQEALKNTTNSYLAFVSEQARSFSTKKDFAVRVEMYKETLQQVAQANAQLKDYFVSVAATASAPHSTARVAAVSVAVGLAVILQ